MRWWWQRASSDQQSRCFDPALVFGGCTGTQRRYSGLNVQQTTCPCIFPYTSWQLYLFKSTLQKKKNPTNFKGPYSLQMWDRSCRMPSLSAVAQELWNIDTAAAGRSRPFVLPSCSLRSPEVDFVGILTACILAWNVFLATSRLLSSLSVTEDADGMAHLSGHVSHWWLLWYLYLFSFVFFMMTATGSVCLVSSHPPSLQMWGLNKMWNRPCSWEEDGSSFPEIFWWSKVTGCVWGCVTQVTTRRSGR